MDRHPGEPGEAQGGLFLGILRDEPLRASELQRYPAGRLHAGPRDGALSALVVLARLPAPGLRRLHDPARGNHLHHQRGSALSSRNLCTVMTEKNTYILQRSPGIIFEHDSGKTHSSRKILYMPLYYEKFIFFDGVLKEYEFGFEYP